MARAVKGSQLPRRPRSIVMFIVQSERLQTRDVMHVVKDAHLGNSGQGSLRRGSA